MVHMKKIDKLIKKYDYISFDIFDTLIYREVPNPHEVFGLVQKEFNSLHAEKPIVGFPEERISAEKKANSMKSDYTLDDIYGFISVLWGDSVADKLKRIEIDVEKKVTYANPRMKNVYDYVLSRGKKIIIVSDMYLSKETISQLLNASGYVGWSELFVSCECGGTKRDGSLFKYVKMKLNETNRTICHFGDNVISDYIMAMCNGIKAIHVKR